MLKNIQATQKPLTSTSEEFNDQTGNLGDDNDETIDCDTNEDPQYDIYMEAQARLEAVEGLGHFLPLHGYSELSVS